MYSEWSGSGPMLLSVQFPPAPFYKEETKAQGEKWICQ